MAFELRDNSGSLFKNDKRLTDAHPNATGTVKIDGVEYFISAWTKEGQRGKWQSLSFTRKDKQAQKQDSAPVDDTDDVPF